MDEIELLRSIAIPLLSVMVVAIVALIKSLSSRLATKVASLDELQVKYNSESGAHQQTKNDLASTTTALAIITIERDKLAGREDIYKQETTRLYNQMVQNGVDYERRFNELKADFDSQINALNVKHQEFIHNRDAEIKTKSDQIIKLEQETVTQANKHLAEIAKQKSEHKKQMDAKDSELKHHQERLERAEKEIAKLSEQLDNLAKRVETQTLTPIPITSDES